MMLHGKAKKLLVFNHIICKLSYDNFYMDQKPPQDYPPGSKEYHNYLIRKRIADQQIKKIKNMTLHQLRQKEKKTQILPPSPTLKHAQMNLQNKLKEIGFTENLSEISQKQLNTMLEIQKNKKKIRKEMREYPIFSQIKRGKLGVDNFFILFAILGSAMIPIYFYFRFQKNRETIVKNRNISPEVIQNLDEDSPIDLDSVSHQTIMYENPDRIKKNEERKQMVQKIKKLEQELDL